MHIKVHYNINFISSNKIKANKMQPQNTVQAQIEPEDIFTDNMDELEDMIVDGEEQEHQEFCQCEICGRQRQIEKMKELYKSQIHLLSTYQRSFNFDTNNHKKGSHRKSVKQQKVKKIKEKKKQQDEELSPALKANASKKNYHIEAVMQKRKNNRRDKNLSHISPHSYLDLKSTYLADFRQKQAQRVNFIPRDNIHLKKHSIPLSTTYSQSYHQTLTPKPDSPMKAFQLPLGNSKMNFKAESTYHKSYKSQLSKPTLPILQKQCLNLSKPLGKMQTTQRDSYHTLQNPQKQHIIRPPNSIINLSSYAHSYDTTYRSMFNSERKKPESLASSPKNHDISMIGNINMRTKQRNQKQQKKKAYKKFLESYKNL